MSTSLFINTNKTMKVLVATDKPFAKIAVDGIRKEQQVMNWHYWRNMEKRQNCWKRLKMPMPLLSVVM